MLSNFALNSRFFKGDPNKIDVMTLGQHYGLATRLLDWTTNPLVALWFSTDPKHDKDGILFIHVCTMTKNIHKDEFKNSIFEPDCPFSSQRDPPLFFKPYSITDRVTNQGSIFSVSKTLHAPNYDREEEGADYIPLISDNKEFMNKVTKIQIDFASKIKIREELNNIGINEFSVFANLENLTDSINKRYTTE